MLQVLCGGGSRRAQSPVISFARCPPLEETFCVVIPRLPDAPKELVPALTAFELHLPLAGEVSHTLLTLRGLMDLDAGTVATVAKCTARAAGSFDDLLIPKHQRSSAKPERIQKLEKFAQALLSPLC